MRVLRRFAGKSAADRRLIIEATILLATASLAVRVFALRSITWVVGLRPGTAAHDDSDTSPAAHAIAVSIRAVSLHTPWATNCLAQALAGCVMLKRRGIASTLYVGVAKDEKAKLGAHAWLRANERTLTGGGGIERYTVVASFVANRS